MFNEMHLRELKKISEEIIFSNGGKGEKKGKWRRYLLKET